jgi:hypothetical protein
MAEPERGHSEGGALPSGGLPEEVGSATASFVAKVLAGQIKTRREGRSPLKSGSIVFLDSAW